MPIAPRDTLLAIKAISLCRGLVDSEKMVGVALIEHFNRTTERCDPGVDRLAELLGLARRTVLRAVDKLEQAGLFDVERHGGHLGRNSYEPCWQRFTDLNAVWDSRMGGKGAPHRSAKSLPQGHLSPVGGDRPVTQTSLENLQKGTSQGLWKEERVARASPSSSNIAMAAAERRWDEALRKACSSAKEYAAALAAIDTEMAAAATATEMRRRGAGIELLTEQLCARAVLLGGDPGAQNGSRVLPAEASGAGGSNPGNSPVSLSKNKVDDG